MSHTINNVIKRQAGTTIYYIGSINSAILQESTFVPVQETSAKTPLIEIPDKDGHEGYQRSGVISRMSKFRNYLKDYENSLVTPIILSGRGKWNFSATSNESLHGQITITDRAAILDGQHRCGGYVLLYEEDGISRDVDFILIENLSIEDEVKEFLTINNEAKGVKASVGAYAGMEYNLDIPALKGLDNRDTLVAWNLNIQVGSPFKGMIARSRLGREQLFNLHSISKNIGRTFRHGAFAKTDPEERTEIVIKYWSLIEGHHQEQWADIEKLKTPGEGRRGFDYKLLELTGFIAWSHIADDILGSSYSSNLQEMAWEKVDHYIEHLAGEIDWGKRGDFDGLTGEVGGRRISTEMERVLSNIR